MISITGQNINCGTKVKTVKSISSNLVNHFYSLRQLVFEGNFTGYLYILNP